MTCIVENNVTWKIPYPPIGFRASLKSPFLKIIYCTYFAMLIETSDVYIAK